MANDDPFAKFKAMQRESWKLFAPLAQFTTPGAAHLVKFAGVAKGQAVLDVACGTGVVAVTAARAGARVKGLDLSPVLLEEARGNAAVINAAIEFTEGDVEALPYKDGEFDVVLSQFGHMFAPRPDVTVKEMLRVLKPGGTIAFSTWPPEMGVGNVFATVGKYAGPPPAGVSPPAPWGDVAMVRQRLGEKVRDLAFDRDTLLWPAASPAHYRVLMEQTSGPVLKLLQGLQSDPAKAAQFRAEIEAVAARHFDPEQNVVRFGYLMTRGTKA